jgi:CelD/BcsL family acetyltransferase involved in cellulose biosynthesis
VRLIIHDTIESFLQLESEWNELLHRSMTNRIFSTFEWQFAWWDTYRAGELWLIACRDEDNRLLGIAPWFIEVRPDERVVRSIGCVDVTDYVDLIVDCDHIEPVLGLFAAFLAEQRGRYDRVNLCNIPQQSPTLMYLPALLNQCGLDTETELQEVCPVIHLPDDWEAYLDGLDKKQRHELRRKLRRASNEHEAVAWYVTGPGHDFDTEIETFLTLMAASQPTKAEFLADARNAAFMRSIARAMHARGWLQLSFLTVRGEPAAAYMNFDYGDGIQVYNSGLAAERFAHLSPGIVLLCYIIQDAIAHRRHVFDFLRGNEEYKYRMGAQDTQVFKLKAT